MPIASIWEILCQALFTHDLFLDTFDDLEKMAIPTKTLTMYSFGSLDL